MFSVVAIDPSNVDSVACNWVFVAYVLKTVLPSTILSTLESTALTCVALANPSAATVSAKLLIFAAEMVKLPSTSVENTDSRSSVRVVIAAMLEVLVEID